MKFRYFVLAITMGMPIVTIAHIQSRTLLKKYLHKKARQKSINNVGIDIPAPFSDNLIFNSSFPLVIDSPGYYVFDEDIFFDGSLASAAISINPNVGEVTIEFGNLSLNQAVAASGVTGIAIGSGNNRVTIRGGTINGFSQSAISVADDCTEIYIDGMSITNCGNRGIEFNGAGEIAHSAITNCVFMGNCTTSAADNIITLSNCDDVIVANCDISDNGVLGSTISGPFVLVQTIGCDRCLFDHVTCSDGLGNTDVRGFSLNSTTNCRFENCSVDNLSSSSICAGFLLEASTGNSTNKFFNCKTTNFSCNYTLDGFLADTDSDDNLFENCDSASHAATNTFGTVHGFRSVNNNRNQFKNCRSHANTAASNAGTGAHGFKLDTCTDVSLQACRASNQSSAGNAVGVLVQNCVSASVFSCVATGNQLGFDHIGTFNDQAFIQNMAFKNTTNYSSAFPITAHDDTAASTPSLLGNPWNNIAIT